MNEKSVPTTFLLSQNYPNPFNPTTISKYGLPPSEHAKLEVFNTLGERAALLVDELKEAGTHEVTFDANLLSSGVYIYKITAGSFIGSRKLLLIK